MSLRDINLKHRTVRRVFHRSLLVGLVGLFPILWLILSIVLSGRRRPSYHVEEAFFQALGYVIAFYVLARVLYWGVYWIIKGFEPKPSESNAGDNYPRTYMFRIVEENDFSSREVKLKESVFRSDDLEETKEICFQHAEHFLETTDLSREWKEFDFGFFIQHGNIRVELRTDLSGMRLPYGD